MLFLVWSYPGFRNPTYQQERSQNPQTNQNRNGNPVVSPSLWDVHTSPEDTYAQWIMAILAIVATGLSFWAVILLRATLDATLQMAKEAENATRAALVSVDQARAIGEAQTRPWICFKDIQINPASSMSIDGVNVGRGYQINVFFENYGQTPAVKVGILREGFSVDKEDTKYKLTKLTANGTGSAIAPPRREMKSPGLSVFGDDLQKFEIGKSKFITHVFVEYKIAESDPVLRVTEFLGEIVIVGSQIDPNGNSVPIYEIAITGDVNRCT
jgi:hypothetical protein